ncbi:hypothetical protein CDL12_29779 [Handroanthus impetiginosus]|uniref:UDP-glucuronosyl and UDP-glucosyl transferase n=1 Tax=Handroanthus impetiginosus TaxID=429701 RepID=A0A2G9FXF2_9LAMI|nr:hypothetical protein CDL12_29779 [Handroanthus impetiginosus]
MPTLMKAFQESSSNFSNIITNLKPDLLIYDSFQPWSAKMASSLGIPCVLFAICGSTTLSFFHHLYTHKTYDSFPYKGIYLHEYEKRDLLVQGESIKFEDIGEGFASGVLELSCEIALTKSYRGIEGKYIDYLSTLCNRRIVPVGPLVVRNQENSDLETIHWLGQKDDFSTLYISFGSENYLSKKQIQEIAKGLELSNANFIWVDRSSSGNENVIEEAFPKGLKDRGKVVKGWANQVEILAHKSVGGFMSHCGWSSITESVYFGVPVMAMPLKLDQPVNSRLVVESGFGVEVIRDENGEFDGEGVAKAINMLFVGESGEGIRRRVRELSEKMRMEEEEGARGVVEELTRICMKKRGKRGDI